MRTNFYLIGSFCLLLLPILRGADAEGVSSAKLESLEAREGKEGSSQRMSEPGADFLNLETNTEIDLGSGDEPNSSKKDRLSEDGDPEELLVLSPEEKLAEAFDDEKNLTFSEIYLIWDEVYKDDKVSKLDEKQGFENALDDFFADDFHDDQINFGESFSNEITNPRADSSTRLDSLNPYLSQNRSSSENPYAYSSRINKEQAVEPITISSKWKPQTVPVLEEPEENEGKRKLLAPHLETNELIKKYGEGLNRP